MKIACVSTSRVPSDTANSIQVMKVCHGLARLGHEVLLFVPALNSALRSGWSVNGRSEEEEKPGEVRWEALSERYGLSARFKICWLPAHPRLQRNDFAFSAVRQVRAARADLLYTWTGQSAVMGLLVGMPVIYEVHDRLTGRFGPLWFRSFLRIKGRKRLAVITRALRKALEHTFGTIPDEQVLIAPNGVDLEQYENLPEPWEARARLNLPEETTVLCAGHLYAGRGAELFLGLAERFPALSFVWVGGRAEDVQRSRSVAAMSGLNNVTFTGFVSSRRLPGYQAAADILLMPYARSITGSSGGNSADICSPMKMFDYLAAGRAILSSDLPVIREVLNDQNAVFAPPEDLAGWQAALERLLEDECLGRQIGERARADAQNYAWRAREEKILSSLSTLIERTG